MKLLALAVAVVIPVMSADLKTAIDALAGLNSVLSIGVSYRDFAARIQDVKATVDRVLAQPPDGKEDSIRAQISSAMRYYELSYQLWNAEIVDPKMPAPIHLTVAQELMTNFRVMGCGPAHEHLDFLKYTGSEIKRTAPEYVDGVRSDSAMFRQAFWSCAGDTVARLLKVAR